MNDQDKAELVKYRLTRARETYKEVEILVKNELWNTAVNRLYYSCFYAVIALLADQDIEVQSHSGARQMFGLHFIKTGKIDPDSGRFLARLFDLRQTGDYDDFIDFDKDKVMELLEPADRLISAIEGLLLKKDQ
jgi:uncharacterized protein (UPF0332 family)